MKSIQRLWFIGWKWFRKQMSLFFLTNLRLVFQPALSISSHRAVPRITPLLFVRCFVSSCFSWFFYFLLQQINKSFQYVLHFQLVQNPPGVLLFRLFFSVILNLEQWILSLALEGGLNSLKLKLFVVHIEPQVAGFLSWKQALLCLEKGRGFSSLK